MLKAFSDKVELAVFDMGGVYRIPFSYFQYNST